MARGLNAIWLRYGLYTSLAMIATITVMVAIMAFFRNLEYDAFHSHLPHAVQQELDYLDENELLDSPRAYDLYDRYWRGNPWAPLSWSLLLGLAVCVLFGLAAGFGISRHLAAPLSSIAETARRLSKADFSVRATTTQKGSLAHVIHDFNAMADSLERLERERRITAAAISHELRTPLAVLQANLHALSDGVVPADAGTYLNMIGQVQHLSRLIDDVHTLSIVDAGELTLHRSTFDLSALASAVLEQFRERLNQAGMAATLSGHRPAFAYADQDRTRQILTNLVENAIRYASQGEKLLITTYLSPGEVSLVVKDWGNGLPATVRDQIFERFYRADVSRTRATGGSGLGLAIVKSLVTAQGGSVEMRSAVGEGCAVRLTLPAQSPGSTGVAVINKH